MNAVLALFGAIVLILGLSRSAIRRTGLIPSETLLACLCGVLIGPAVFNWVHIQEDTLAKLLEQAARLTTALTIMSLVMRYPIRLIRCGWKSLLSAALAITAGMWLTSAGLSLLLLPVPAWVALSVAAAITPTDPILAGTITSGRMAEVHLPARVRHLITAEAGANDGLGYVFVYLALSLQQTLSGAAILRFAAERVLVAVGVAALVGAALGAAAGYLTGWAHRNHYREAFSGTAVVTTLALLVLGVADLLSVDAFVAVLLAAIAFCLVMRDAANDLKRDVDGTILPFFALPIFLLFGMALPWAAWRSQWPTVLWFPLVVLLLRRIPVIVPLGRRIALLRRRADFWFVGWFGPIGVAALYYALLVQRLTGQTEIYTVVSAVIAGSIVLHGITSTWLTTRFPRPGPHGT